MRPDLSSEDFSTPLEAIELMDLQDRYWLSHYEPLLALYEYLRFIADGGRPN